MHFTVPENWPGNDVNVEVWSMVTPRPRQKDRVYWVVRVTHRATGAVSVTRSRSGRSALCEALLVARRRAGAYETLGLADLADQVREWRQAA